MRKRTPHALVFASAIFMIVGLLVAPHAIRPLANNTPVTAASQAFDEEPDKEAMHARMKELQQSIDALWQQYGQSGDETLRTQITDKQQEMDSISAELGGDRPVPDALPEQQQSVRTEEFSEQAAATTGCPTTTTNFSTSPGLRIPATGTRGTITSTLTVSGLNPKVWDVDVTTAITHTACADLDITIKSPAGTIVTLTTDNGGSLDNVFNGTVWDDQADPGSPIPYAVNPNLASDHSYSNNVVAPRLAPEEALAAFNGENPNGVWTLTVSDDALGDIGNLASWSLAITTLSATATETTVNFPSADPHLPALVANGCIGEVGGPVASTVSVAGMGAHTSNIRVWLKLPHLNPEDLDITLTSPHGTVVTLTTDNGPLTFDAFDGTWFSNNANPGGQVPYGNCLLIFPCNQGLTTDRVYPFAGTAANLVPEEPLSAFNGENPNGTWTLNVIDDSCNLQIGTLKEWSVEVTTATCCTLSCPTNLSVGTDAGKCTAVVNFAPTPVNDCDIVTCSPASGSTFPKGTTTVSCTSAAGPSCSFTVTVNDTEAPKISCAPVLAVGVAAPGGCTVVGFPTPSATDNCSGVGVVCNPPSGSCFPVGVTTITCIATDASGNKTSTASCGGGGAAVQVAVFDTRLQDDTVPTRVVAFNSLTGDYMYCCDGLTLTGKASKITKKGGDIQLEDNRTDRRVLIKVSRATGRGTASVTQLVPPNFRCEIEDRNIYNDTMICGGLPQG